MLSFTLYYNGVESTRVSLIKELSAIMALCKIGIGDGTSGSSIVYIKRIPDMVLLVLSSMLIPKEWRTDDSVIYIIN